MLLLIGRLGFFHLLKCILDTLNLRSARYWEALVELKAVFYRYNSDDESQLLGALEDDSFARDGWNTLQQQEYHAIKHSKKWKEATCERYSIPPRWQGTS
jgi:hypothetical protein